MSDPEYDKSREHRITNHILVHAHTQEEQAMSWYNYLEGKLHFPFKAKWFPGGSTAAEEVIEVLEMSSEEECWEEMFVEVLYKEGTVEDVFSVALSNLEVVAADEHTKEAIADWHYWVDKGYQL